MSTQAVQLSGELDAALAAARRAELMQICDDRAGSLLILDLADVTFVDSTGLGLLIGVARRLRDRGGELRLRGCRRSVRRVLTLSGLDHVLSIEASAEPSDASSAAAAVALPLAGGQR
jgi:anti-sigma B factor antagonist